MLILLSLSPSPLDAANLILAQEVICGAKEEGQYWLVAGRRWSELTPAGGNGPLCGQCLYYPDYLAIGFKIYNLMKYHLYGTHIMGKVKHITSYHHLNLENIHGSKTLNPSNLIRGIQKKQ